MSSGSHVTNYKRKIGSRNLWFVSPCRMCSVSHVTIYQCVRWVMSQITQKFRMSSPVHGTHYEFCESCHKSGTNLECILWVMSQIRHKLRMHSVSHVTVYTDLICNWRQNASHDTQSQTITKLTEYEARDRMWVMSQITQLRMRCAKRHQFRMSSVIYEWGGGGRVTHTRTNVSHFTNGFCHKLRMSYVIVQWSRGRVTHTRTSVTHTTNGFCHAWVKCVVRHTPMSRAMYCRRNSKVQQSVMGKTLTHTHSHTLTHTYTLSHTDADAHAHADAHMFVYSCV